MLGIGVWVPLVPGGFQTPVARDLHGVVGLGWVALRCQVEMGVWGGGGFGWCGGWVLGAIGWCLGRLGFRILRNSALSAISKGPFPAL